MSALSSISQILENASLVWRSISMTRRHRQPIGCFSHCTCERNHFSWCQWILVCEVSPLHVGAKWTEVGAEQFWDHVDPLKKQQQNMKLWKAILYHHEPSLRFRFRSLSLHATRIPINQSICAAPFYCVTLIERNASVFLTVLKIIPSVFLNTLVYRNTVIPPKPNCIPKSVSPHLATQVDCGSTVSRLQV